MPSLVTSTSNWSPHRRIVQLLLEDPGTVPASANGRGYALLERVSNIEETTATRSMMRCSDLRLYVGLGRFELPTFGPPVA